LRAQTRRMKVASSNASEVGRASVAGHFALSAASRPPRRDQRPRAVGCCFGKDRTPADWSGARRPRKGGKTRRTRPRAAAFLAATRSSKHTRSCRIALFAWSYVPRLARAPRAAAANAQCILARVSGSRESTNLIAACAVLISKGEPAGAFCNLIALKGPCVTVTALACQIGKQIAWKCPILGNVPLVPAIAARY